MSRLRKIKMHLKALWLGQIVGLKILIKIIKKPEKISSFKSQEDLKLHWYKVGHRLGKIVINNGY